MKTERAPTPFVALRNRRGFSLLETLLALAIFGIVIVSVGEAVVMQTRSEKLAEDMTRAVLLAQNIVEEIRYGEDYGEEEESGSFEGEDAGFDWEYQVTEADVDGLFKISVAVTWSDGQGRKEYRTETLMSER